MGGIMSPQDFRVVCLQKYPEFYEETITLLNNQWPRSRTARLRSLEQGSANALPTSLVLLHRDKSGKESVVAHSKISPVPYQPQMCFVESVVVAPELRGKGLGRLIMDKTETYVKSLGSTIVYLTTFDQQGFYSRLGYELCDPIVVFGGSMKLVQNADAFKTFSFTHNERDKPANSNQSQIQSKDTTNLVHQDKSPKIPMPPPPPPPPPVTSNNVCNNNIITASKVTMRKRL